MAPLPHASVFIDKSLLGSETDSTGRFLIRRVPPGAFEVVATLIGFEAQKQEVVITGAPKDSLVFKLRPIVLKGPEVVVTAEEDKKWRRDLARFTELLLSSTPNVAETRILNAEVLTFQENEAGQFQAEAAVPLLIENQALGYKLEFVLVNFVATAQSLSYAGLTKFAELVPKSEEQVKRWEKNRRRAYRGSLRHFLRIICGTGERVDVRLKKEGFVVFSFKYPWAPENQRATQPVNWMTFFRAGAQPHEVLLAFPDYLGVKYMREYEERGYLRHHQIERDARAQESWLKLEQEVVSIDRSGRYLSDAALREFGYWAWKRLADMLPVEYEP